jgi:hypothetical protein
MIGERAGEETDGSARQLLARARGEYLEMPGLQLTVSQAARLWALDRATSEEVLERLVSIGFLWRSQVGTYLRASLV